jgi:hypothetical protein
VTSSPRHRPGESLDMGSLLGLPGDLVIRTTMIEAQVRNRVAGCGA